jgi:hypothetical protein
VINNAWQRQSCIALISSLQKAEAVLEDMIS